MEDNNLVAPAQDTMLKNVTEYATYLVPRQFTATAAAPPPTVTFDYSHHLQFDGQQSYYANPQNCFVLPPSAPSYPSFIENFTPPLLPRTYKNCKNHQQQSTLPVYYAITDDNINGYRWQIPEPVNGPYSHQQYRQKPKIIEPNKTNLSQPDGDCDYGNAEACKNAKTVSVARLNNKMHPVQLLHQIFRKEAFVMEYERVNDGPFSRVRVTYKVNGRSYVSEASRLKEARRLCAKQVLRDQFPQLCIDADGNVPQPEYDLKRFANKHPVQILFQVLRREPMEMHCEEQDAAHFAKHIFTFVVRGRKYRAKAETIKEAKRRAAILALNDYFKGEGGDGFDCQGEGDASFGYKS